MIHKSFKEFLQESEFNEFNQSIDQLILQLESGHTLNEGLLDKFTTKVKDGIEFIKKLSELIGTQLVDMLKIFKQKVVYTFFVKIKWSIKRLVSLVKQGYNLWKDLHTIIAEYIASTGVVKWTEDKLQKLDDFLKEHPSLKRIGGLVVAGFLIYQWTQMISFTGDIDFDFDQTTLFDVIKGSYSLVEIFATPDGIKMLMFIATGVLTGLSVPWPGDTWVLFALSLIYTVSKDKYPKVSNYIITNIKKYKNIKE